MNLSTQERIDLIKSIAADGGEIVGEDELKAILESGEQLFTYDGFEPSGQMHIAQGIIRAINTNKMIAAGFTFRMWVADWFGYLNNKMGGDLEKIKTVGSYFIEIWKASGMDLDNTEFLWTSDFVGKREYWELVMKVAKASTLKRVLRTTEIMGRKESDDLSAAQILYPCMQTADIFGVMKCQVTQLGMDQRKVNMLAREVGPELGFNKPVVVSHRMLRGLGSPVDEKSEENLDLSILDFEELKQDTPKMLMEGIIEADEPTFDLQQSTYFRDLKQLNHIKFVIRLFPNKQDLTLVFHDYQLDKTEHLNIKLNEWTEQKLDTRFKIELVDEKRMKVIVETPDPIKRAIAAKMSKSIPDSAIFMTDTEEDVKRKITKAYCTDGVIEDNPILEYCKYIIFQAKFLKGQQDLLKDGFIVERPEKWGGNIIFNSYEELEKAFANKELSSIDLKGAVIIYLNRLLQPVRDHFENDANAKAILEQVKSFQVTR